MTTPPDPRIAFLFEAVDHILTDMSYNELPGHEVSATDKLRRKLDTFREQEGRNA